MRYFGRLTEQLLANLKWLLIGFVALTMGTAASAQDLQITDYVSAPDPVAESADATFTITAANNSAQAVNNPVVTIDVPSNFEVTAGDVPAFCSVSGAVGSQTITCNLPTLVRNSPQTFSYTATALTSGAASTTATISAAGITDPNSGNDSVTITPTVRNGADLSVAKAGSAPNVIAGGTLTYTLTVQNAGPSTTSAVRVTDNLPAASDFDFQSAGGTGWSCSRSGQTVTCDYSGAAPAPGNPYPDISIVGQIISNSAGTISNIASVEITELTTLDPDLSNNTSNTVVTNVEAGSDLAAQKSMPSTIIVGESATIRLTISNTGPQTVPAGVTISDTIDSSLTIGALPAGCTQSGQTVTCTAGSLNAPGQAVFDIPVTGNTPTGGQVNNVATLTPVPGFPDPDSTNNTDTVQFEVEAPNADLRVRAKNKFPNPVAPGSNVNSRIFVRNDGPSIASYSAANPLIVTDQLGPNETFVSGPANFDCTTAPNAGGTLVTCRTNTTGTLAVGSDLRLDLVTTANAGTNGTITNEACTDTTAGSMHTPSSPTSPSGDDCFSRGVTATTSSADLTIDKSVSLSPSSGFTGNLTIPDTVDVFYIQLVARNRTGDPAANVRVRDLLPNVINSGGLTTGVTLESFTTPSAPSFSYQPNNNRVDINFNNLVVGSPQTFVLRVERPFGSGTFTNTATIFSSNTTETDNSNNSDDANYTIGPVADMTINNKSVTPDPMRVGVPATYLISVRNDGANPAEDVVVTDVIDPALFDIIGTPTTTKPGGSCSVVPTTGTVTCNLNQFIRNEIRQVQVEVLPKFPFGSTSFTNRATVETSSLDSDGGNDPNAGNNFFDLVHDVDPPAFDLAVTKVETNPATDDPVRFDETLNYDIRVSNFGPSRATDVLLTDIPAPPSGLTMTLDTVTINPVAANSGLSLQAAPNAGCSPSGANVLCRIDTTSTADNFLDPGNQVIFRLTFTTGGTPPSGVVTFGNAAEVTAAEQTSTTGAGADSQLPNNTASQNTTVLPSTDLEIVSKVRNGALLRSVNEPVEYVIQFRNNGPSTATEVIITDVLPTGFVYSATPAPSTSIPGGSGASVTGVNCTGTGTITCTVTGNFPAGAANTVDLSVFAVAEAPYSGDVAPTNATNTATITPGVDGFGDPLSEDPNNANNDGSANTQIQPSSLSGTVYGDANENDTIDAGEGQSGITVTLSGDDAFGNMVSFTATTDGNGNYTFPNLPPSDSNGYQIVETESPAFYDRAETAGSVGGTVNNGTFGDSAAENTISAVVLAASTDATGYIFQNRPNAVIDADDDNPAAVVGAMGGDDIINVLDNDEFNGATATLGEIDINIVNPATPINGGSVPVLDPATGLVDVPAGTPAGTYTIDYEICDEDDPDNCAPATVTIEVTAASIMAVDDSETGINGLTGQTNVLNVLDDDMLDGAAADIADVTITVATGFTVPAGLTFDPATGNVSVDPGTPAGTYTFDYTICETINPMNCSTATVTIDVDAAPILAVDDSASGIDGAVGQANVLNVLDDDTLNGDPATTGEVVITVATGSTVPAGLTFDPATGNVSVDPGTPAGTYQFDYTICEILNPMNCSTATATVSVDATPILAVDDTRLGVNGQDGEADVLNVLDDDTLDGAPATTSNVTITLATGSTVPAGLTFDPATGSVSVDPGTPTGTYSFDYTICEIAVPTNCSTATATVTVDAVPIVAVDDSATGINGLDGQNDVLNVLDDDTLDGDPVDLTTVTLTVATGSSVPAGLTFDPATGSVSVDPGTAAGTYQFDYTICEILNPMNCSTATATVVVDAAPIAAVDDSVGGINGADGGDDVLNVLTGDTLNGDPATTGNVVITVATGSSVPAGLTFDPATGDISVDPGTPAGTYEFDYTICEILNPMNCSTATATVEVIAAPIEANPDVAAPTNGADGANGVIDVLPNDTLNGVPADLSTVDITVVTPADPVNGGLVPVLDPATGLVNVPPGTPAGNYEITYQICEEINPTNCAATTVTVPVEASEILAEDVSVNDIVGANGADDVLNVLTGDTLNGAPATTDNVTITVAPGSAVPAGLTFDPATGSISVDPGTPAGTYSFDYQICETLNPTNCTTATATVTVIAAPIEATDDSEVEIDSSFDQPNVLNVFDGDTIDGQPAGPDNAILTIAPGSSLPPGITFDPATGIVGVERGTPEGDYSFEYQICEALNPTNCTTATVNLNVVPTAGGISGVVFLDENLNRTFEGGEDLQTGWTVQVVRNGEVVATVQTDADGFYTVEDLLAGDDYEVRFFSPNGGAQFGSIEDITIAAGTTTTDQNQPIDPSGVVYDAISRQPVTGAVVNLVDQFGNILPDVCYIDPSQSGQITGPDGFYRFDIVAGADPACPVGRTEYALQVTAPNGFADPISTIIAPEDGSLNVAGLGDPAAVVPNSLAPQVGEPTTYFLSFLIAQGDANVVNNHIPLDPFTDRPDLLVTKTSTKRTASVGELVPYTITVRNTEATDRDNVDIVDILPPGFKYVPGSARVNDVPEEPAEAVRELRWEDQFLAGNATSVYSIIAVIGAGVSEGDRINTAVAQNGNSNAEVSNRAQAVVTITASAIFDCAEIIGKVFDDFDGDGYQDEGEPGIPGARVATVNGELITTDEFGRYHITCAAVPNAQIGSNFVLKLDPRTIPDGYTPSTDNPQSIRLTRGKISELNFGVVKGRVITIAIDDRAFESGVVLKPAFAGKLADLARLEEQRLVIQVTYSAGASENDAMIADRLSTMRSAIEAAFADDEWDGPPPTIETNMVRAANGAATSSAGGE